MHELISFTAVSLMISATLAGIFLIIFRQPYHL